MYTYAAALRAAALMLLLAATLLAGCCAGDAMSYVYIYIFIIMMRCCRVYICIYVCSETRLAKESDRRHRRCTITQLKLAQIILKMQSLQHVAPLYSGPSMSVIIRFTLVPTLLQRKNRRLALLRIV